jgi:isoquinoline 1-oxidoreductase beta subunit
MHPSMFGARPDRVDDTATLALPGVLAVVPLPEGVAVVAETPHDAYRGLQALQVTWDETDAERRSTEELFAEHRRVIETGEAAVLVRDEGDASAVLAGAAHTIDVLYEVPHLAHAPMEPNNAVCRLRDDGVLEVWASSESPEYTRTAAAEAAGIEADQVQVHVPLAGGSFGLHYSTTNGKDPTIEATQIGRALGWKHPVKVQSLREEEFKIGQFRAMAVHRVRAGTDDAGRVTAVHHHIAAQPTSVNLPFVRDVMFTNNVDFFSTTGVADHPYTYPGFTLESSNVATGVPTMTWRSVGNSHSEFARECALDELATASGRDPVELRRELLVDNPRTLRALEIAVAAGGWGDPPTDGRARGIATSGFLGHSAQLTEISRDDRGRIGLDRIVFALDCGIVVNPDLVRAQVEGGLLYALSAAIWGEVVLGEGGVIETQNFDRYRVMRMQSVPRIEIHLIGSEEPPTGVGEVSVPTAAPALANAVAALTGTRIRRLPMSRSVTFH